MKINWSMRAAVTHRPVKKRVIFGGICLILILAVTTCNRIFGLNIPPVDSVSLIAFENENAKPRVLTPNEQSKVIKSLRSSRPKLMGHGQCFPDATLTGHKAGREVFQLQIYFDAKSIYMGEAGDAHYQMMLGSFVRGHALSVKGREIVRKILSGTVE